MIFLLYSLLFSAKKTDFQAIANKKEVARPERFELPTNWFEASYSIQLSYGRILRTDLIVAE